MGDIMPCNCSAQEDTTHLLYPLLLLLYIDRLARAVVLCFVAGHLQAIEPTSHSSVSHST
jgi:hypothetical protein